MKSSELLGMPLDRAKQILDSSGQAYHIQLTKAPQKNGAAEIENDRHLYVVQMREDGTVVVSGFRTPDLYPESKGEIHD